MTNGFKAAREAGREMRQEITEETRGVFSGRAAVISVIVCLVAVLAGIFVAVKYIKEASFSFESTMTSAERGTVHGEIVFSMSLRNTISKAVVTLRFDDADRAETERARLELHTTEYFASTDAGSERTGYYERLEKNGSELKFELTEGYLSAYYKDRVYSDDAIRAVCARIADAVFMYDCTGAEVVFHNDGSSTVEGMVSCRMTYTLAADMTVSGIQVDYLFEDGQSALKMKGIVEDESQQYYGKYLETALALGIITGDDPEFREYGAMTVEDTRLYYDYSDVYIAIYNKTGGCVEDAVRGFVMAGGDWRWIRGGE